MIHLNREPAPEFWTRERIKRWTKQWLAKDCDSNRWAWPQYQNRRLNLYAGEAMETWHHHKCAFCETPLMGEREIEHFRSKTQHPLTAFIWRNLFLICGTCNQRKGSETHEGCVKPDREDPADYLWVNPISLIIEPKPGISEEARQRAITTITRYKLDRPELKKLYEAHLLKEISGKSPLEFLRLVLKASDDDPRPADQIPFLRAKLRTLVHPSQPFSLMVKSILEY